MYYSDRTQRRGLIRSLSSNVLGSLPQLYRSMIFFKGRCFTLQGWRGSMVTGSLSIDGLEEGRYYMLYMIVSLLALPPSVCPSSCKAAL